jgi:F420H(2)-dependent quinone reductase
MEKSHTMATPERTVRGRHFSDRLIAGVLRIFSRVHITLYRWTGGIIGERIFGNRMLLLTTTGRKTGQPRTKPLGYLTDGDALAIVAGAAGAAKHPDWWLNLESHPEALVQVGRRKLRVSATRALPEEQQRLWARYPAQHALFESMRHKCDTRPSRLMAITMSDDKQMFLSTFGVSLCLDQKLLLMIIEAPYRRNRRQRAFL